MSKERLPDSEASVEGRCILWILTNFAVAVRRAPASNDVVKIAEGRAPRRVNDLRLCSPFDLVLNRIHKIQMLRIPVF